MKLMTATMIIAMVCATFAGESATADQVQKAPANYLNCIKHTNTGVVASSIANVVKLKLYYPECEMDDIITELERLVREGKNESIRYKAFLATQFLLNPSLLARIEAKSYTDDDVFFKLLSSEMQEAFLTSR